MRPRADTEQVKNERRELWLSLRSNAPNRILEYKTNEKRIHLSTISNTNKASILLYEEIHESERKSWNCVHRRIRQYMLLMWALDAQHIRPFPVQTLINFIS